MLSHRARRQHVEDPLRDVQRVVPTGATARASLHQTPRSLRACAGNTDGLENPSTRLPSDPPFVLPEDRRVLDRHPATARNLLFDRLPVPYFGEPDAPVVLLTLNPGGRTRDADFGFRYVEERLRQLRFEGTVPFLSEEFAATPGYQYWAARLRWLSERVGFHRVINGLFCIQWFPYQSLRFREPAELLPSQHYSFALCRRAIREKREIVILRSRVRWLRAVPELRRADFIELRNPRAPYLSPKNMGDAAFERLVARLSAGREPGEEST